MLDERVAFWITDILADDSARIPAFGEGSALVLSRPAAAKTGTTTDWRDNWTVGYTPDWVVGVWAGNADNEAMVDVSGISGAAPIWHDLMEEVLKGTPVHGFATPPGMVQVEICADSGLLPNPYCPHRRREWFIAGRVPQTVCSMHRMVQVDRRSGDLATIATPPEDISEQVGTFLPAEAAEWAYEQKLASGVRFFLAEPSAGAGSSTPEMRIALTQPIDGASYRLVSSVPAANQRIPITASPVGDLSPSGCMPMSNSSPAWRGRRTLCCGN